MSYQETIASYAQVPGIIEAFHAVEKQLGYLPEEAIAEAAKSL